jgi:inner membrane transporter RhtA
VERLPPQSFFLVSAVFHYLGPSLAVLLFTRVDVLGVAWLRIASAAALFAVWRRPWRVLARLDRSGRRALAWLGIVLATMNSLFYLAVARLPLSTVGAIEFLGTVLLAALGMRSRRNAVALALTAGIDRLGASMLVAAVVATPIGLGGALPAFAHPALLLAGAGVGICSSVVPYVTDQLAMARLPRATFALMLALLPVFATIIGAIVLRQLPTGQDLLAIGLVAGGVALHQAAPSGHSRRESAWSTRGWAPRD